MAAYRIPGTYCFTDYGYIDDGTMCRLRGWSPDALTLLQPQAADPAPTQPAAKLSLSDKATTLLKGVESLRLKPYDDQTQKDITEWVKGATVGYGHLIKQPDWPTFKAGITEAAANDLFDKDLSPFVKEVQTDIKVDLRQNQFDALAIFAFNIGRGRAGFAGSSVVQLINNPRAVTKYKDLEAAWKSWSKSQGKTNKGLVNRRKCEWDIYSLGIYKRW